MGGMGGDGCGAYCVASDGAGIWCGDWIGLDFIFEGHFRAHLRVILLKNRCFYVGDRLPLMENNLCLESEMFF